MEACSSVHGDDETRGRVIKGMNDGYHWSWSLETARLSRYWSLRLGQGRGRTDVLGFWFPEYAARLSILWKTSAALDILEKISPRTRVDLPFRFSPRNARELTWTISDGQRAFACRRNSFKITFDFPRVVCSTAARRSRSHLRVYTRTVKYQRTRMVSMDTLNLKRSRVGQRE